MNVAAMTQYHVMKKTTPLTRLLTFEEGQSSVRVQCYLHTSNYAPQGWYDQAERTVPLRRPFSFETIGPES